jgi:acetylornithine deacetylase
VRTEVVQTLSRLVAMPTVSDRPVTAIAAYLAQRAEDVGFEIRCFETSPGKVNLVALAGPDSGGGLVLSGHMDVVPVEGQKWSADPFALRVDGDRLHGRGSCDMKGFIAAVVESLSPELVEALANPLALIWTHDEEVGCLGSAALASQVQALDRPLPSLAWIGEPTGFKVCNLHPGHSAIEIHCSGRPAHSSRPELGLSAIRIAGQVIQRLEDFQRTLEGERDFEDQLDSPWTILNIARIEGGSAINIIPEHCSIQVGIRPLPGQGISAIFQRMTEAIEPVRRAALAQGGALEILLGHSTPSLHTGRDCSLMPTLLEHASSPDPIGAPFATDGGNLAKLGIESLIFGPGSIDQAHRADEYISAAQLFRTVDLVQEVVRSRCGV